MAEVVLSLTEREAKTLIQRRLIQVADPTAFYGHTLVPGPLTIDWPHGVRRAGSRVLAEQKLLAAIFDAFPHLQPAADQDEKP